MTTTINIIQNDYYNDLCCYLYDLANLLYIEEKKEEKKEKKKEGETPFCNNKRNAMFLLYQVSNVSN